MSSPIPYGERENLHREFKSAEALKNPEIIGRAVVAMLNAEGGVVWVGLREEGERAVAIEPIPDPDREGRRLHDYLVDAIEPSPLGTEVAVEPQKDDQGAVLSVKVRPQPDRKPYALLKGGRQFVIRVGARTRPMTRQEIFGASGYGGEKDSSREEERAAERLRRDRDEAQKGGKPLFWLGLEPAVEVTLDVQDRRLEDCLRDPLLSGNRLAGWNFASAEHRPIWKQGKLSTSPAEWRHVEIEQKGTLRFTAPLESLHWKGESQEIWPYILLEYPISALRIARYVYEGKFVGNERVLGDMALLGVRGWKLRSGSLGSGGRPKPYQDADDLVWPQPLVFQGEEIDREPDRCGFRLVERVYEAFGFRRDQIPKEFDQKSGRLILPE
jgi:schlafen family protein